ASQTKACLDASNGCVEVAARQQHVKARIGVKLKVRPMRHLISSIAAIALASSFAAAIPSSASARPSPWQWDPTIHCSEPGGPCVGTSAGNYQSCVDLGLQRGFNLGKGDRRFLDLFVYQCLAGRVPR